MAFLRSLPETAQPEAASEREVTLAHGSPRQPVWEYILDIQTATRSFEYFSTSYCFTGHTHLPMLYQLTDGRRMARVKSPEPQSRLELTPRAILNPGSVGQPRDRDARAAYAIYHPETHAWDFHRVAYNIPEVQERMRAAGLPERHILRLSGGW
jgi:diadenosine tetraphosphatase ApaH/serine/threonine PP2A family protein phosphatase